MTKKHVHCDLIKAWADGAQIQWKSKHSSVWCDCHETEPPEWHDNLNYRVKPEPKLDTTIFCETYCDEGIPRLWYYSSRQESIHNLKLVFDGESGNLKGAQVLE